MNQNVKTQLINHFRKRSETPNLQIKQLAIGTIISLVAMTAIIFIAQFENQILFYFFALILFAGIIYAIPGYIGIWVWRMRETLFKDK
ncbi:MAG: hypothetical protein ACPGJI_08445 [Kangiellaceae bacterium]